MKYDVSLDADGYIIVNDIEYHRMKLLEARQCLTCCAVSEREDLEWDIEYHQQELDKCIAQQEECNKMLREMYQTYLRT